MATLHPSNGLADDRLPLLTNEEGVLEEDEIEIEFHGTKQKSSLSGDDALGVSDGGDREKGSRRGFCFKASASGAPFRRKKHYSGSEMIVAVFVVAFDTKKGSSLLIIRSLSARDL